MGSESSIAIWLTPVAVALVAGVFTLIVSLMGVANSRRQARAERQTRLDAQLSDKRRELYAKILEPFVTGLAPDAVWEKDRGPRKRTSCKWLRVSCSA